MSTAARAIPRDPIAPWAEVVPGAPPTAVEMLLSLADDGWIYEVVDGRLVRMAGSGQRASTIAARLLARLFAYVEAKGLGVVTGADGVYKFPHAETGLIPDVGFYLGERQALVVDPDKPIPFAPDFAVEVASPSQGQEDMDGQGADVPTGRDTRGVGYLAGHAHRRYLVSIPLVSARYDVFRSCPRRKCGRRHGGGAGHCAGL